VFLPTNTAIAAIAETLGYRRVAAGGGADGDGDDDDDAGAVCLTFSLPR